MNELKIFTYKNSEVRTVEKNNEPWFVLKDVCAVLGISHVTDTANRMDFDEVGQTEVIDSVGRIQKAYVVNESGLYNVILRSDKPEAKPFRKWVTGTVLPSIRKTGGYIAGQETMTDSELMAKALIVAQRQIESKTKQIEEMTPKALFADAVSASKTSILVGDLAKLIRQNGLDIGQNRLFQWLRDNGYLIKAKGMSWNMPTQRSMDLGLFEVKETSITHSDGHISVNKTVKVTGKGQIYFVNKLVRK